MRVALAQIDPALGETDHNLQRAAEGIHEAVVRGADLIVFPQLATSGHSLGQVTHSVALPGNDPRLSDLATHAKGAGVLIGLRGLREPGRRRWCDAVLGWVARGRPVGSGRRREVPLVEEARLGLVEREVRRLVDEGGDL